MSKVKIRPGNRQGGRTSGPVSSGRRPPPEHRFRPGQSGNPRGRPPGSKNEATILRGILNRRVEIRERGRVRKIPLFEAMLLRVAEEGLKGDTKAVGFLLNRHRLLQSGEADPNEVPIDDRKILDDFLRKFTTEKPKDKK